MSRKFHGTYVYIYMYVFKNQEYVHRVHMVHGIAEKNDGIEQDLYILEVIDF